MGKSEKKVFCKGYIRVDGALVDLQSLSPEQRNILGSKLKVQILNNLYKGKGEFYAKLPSSDHIFPQDFEIPPSKS